MGDRVLFQVVKSAKEFGPVVYGHWSGSDSPAVCARLKARMKGRPGDVEFTSARLVQELVNGDDGNLSFGVWNAKRVQKAEDSHGDAGVVLVHVDGPKLRFEYLGGYLTEDGKVPA